MTKTFVRLALVGAAAVALATPAAPASASAAPCSGTFVVDCIKDAVAVGQVCIPYGTFEICVP